MVQLLDSDRLILHYLGFANLLVEGDIQFELSIFGDLDVNKACTRCRSLAVVLKRLTSLLRGINAYRLRKFSSRSRIVHKDIGKFSTASWIRLDIRVRFSVY